MRHAASDSPKASASTASAEGHAGRSILGRQRADEVHQVPPVGVRKAGLPGRHGRSRKAVGDPFEELRVGVHAGHRVEGQVGRPGDQAQPERAIAFATGSVARSRNAPRRCASPAATDSSVRRRSDWPARCRPRRGEVARNRPAGDQGQRQEAARSHGQQAPTGEPPHRPAQTAIHPAR